MWATLARAIRDQDDELDAMAAIRVPTLVLVGEQDEPFLGPSRAMAARVPGARLVVIPDAGHSPQFENPAAWRAALEGFLAGLGPPAVAAPGATPGPAGPAGPVGTREAGRGR